MGADNHLLASLAPADAEALRQRASLVELRRDQLLAEVGQPVIYAYLPTTAIISVVALMRDGRTVESRTIGRESGFGLLHALGSRVSFERVTAEIGGEALKAPVDALAELAARSPSLVRAIVGHAQATIVQAAQNTACNALHGVEKRLCRWLLLTHDRVGDDVLPLTQEHLSVMLGVQRTTVTAIASELQARRWIAYTRGRITILDREGLESATCECYGAVEDAVARILEL